MLEQLLTLLTTLKQIACYAILLSYKTGQLIVFGIKTSFDLISTITSTIWAGLVVIAEDFGIFALDLSVTFRTAFQTLVNLVDNIANGILQVIFLIINGIQNTSNIVCSVYNEIILVLTRIISFLSHLLNFVKSYFVLFGQGVWFAVTIIPITLGYIFMSTTYLVGRFFEELGNIIFFIYNNFKNVLVNLYEFITDVPVESFAGLIIALCLSYVLIKCHIILFRFLYNILTNLIDKCRSKFTFSLKSESANNSKNGTCVICFERSKCLLTMPCRHLCMCLECWDQLQRYQTNNGNHNCPVCRKTVQYTIHVY